MNSKKINNYIEILFTVLLLLEGFLQTSCYTFGNRIISYVIWPMTAIGGLCVLFNMFKYKEYLKDKKNWLLIIFCLSFLVSSILMRRYGFYKNVRTLIFIAFQFFILYLYNKDNTLEEHEKKIKFLLYVYLSGTFVLSSISLYHLLTGYSYHIYVENAPQLVFGFTWGRLFGAYWDPNIASLICCVSLAIIAYFHDQTKNIFAKIGWLLFALLQIIYITFSDSRTGKICLVVVVLAYSILTFIKGIMDGKPKKIKNYYMKMISIVIISVGLAFGTPILLKKFYNTIVNISIEKTIEKKASDSNTKLTEEEKEDIKESYQNIIIGRGYDLESDISNRRFDIWKSGLEIFKKNPLFGVGRRTIVAYAKDNMPDTYIVNNTQMDFHSMHNLYVDLLVSQGLFGFIPFIIFGIISAINIITKLKYLFTKSKYIVMLLSIVFTVVVSTLVMTEIVYVDSPCSTIFWIALGYLNYLCLQKKVKE